MRVKVYKNLNNGLWSIKCSKAGVVLGYASSLILTHCDFVVYELGRQRVLREKQKNVHAFVIGTLSSVDGFNPFKGRTIETIENNKKVTNPEIVTYDPYKYPSFVSTKDLKPITKADRVLLSGNTVIKNDWM